MTTTNQAFIKAYRHDPAEPPRTAPAPNAQPRQAAEQPAAPAVATGTAPRTATATSTNAAQTAATTHGAVSAPRSALYGPRPTATNRPSITTMPSATNTSTPAKRPLSSFIAARPNASTTTTSKDTDFLRPGTTVASFHWPQVCRILTQQHAQQFAQLTDRILHEADAGRTLVGILGLRQGVGATTTALCLAARLATPGRRVIVVDANFTSPRLAEWVEAVPTSGWQDVLKHGSQLADAVIRAQDDHLDLLALDGKKPVNPAKLVGGLQAVVTAGVLRHAYDLVIVDAGAFFHDASQPVVLELTRNMGLDAAVAVTGPQPVAQTDLITLKSSLARSGCELLGLVQNRAA